MKKTKKLKKLMIDRDMTIKTLAENTDITDRQLGRIVNGHSNGSMAWWKRAAEYLQVNLTEIIED